MVLHDDFILNPQENKMLDNCQFSSLSSFKSPDSIHVNSNRKKEQNNNFEPYISNESDRNNILSD